MTILLEEHLSAGTRSAAADQATVGERIAASLEVIARELELIRAHLEETAGETTAVTASSGPWLRRPPAR